ncbi:hypothetical protein DN069_11925 [Streptacidiphilus pinicola]|uniref:Uncharacterized protein n=1 Tax=Streptacidiphilus pinicola TaxID=2219663 RepID=A0A2X0IQ92_9ACTN|nr:hypothetical protein [Streptacidiphilus pinicola]RAG85361.1 hypothetical protein DN069_11925 [Streptacidiphilus pinicola]
MHTHRRSRSRVLGALAVLVVGAAGLTACASGSTTVGGSSAPPVASSSPSRVNPGGPIVTPSPTPPTQTGGAGSSTGPGSGSGTPAKPAHGLPISGYSTKGNVLTVYFYAGVCDKYGVTADQSQPGEVRVAVVVTQHAPTGQMCPMVISSQHAGVDLGRPLDGRKVIDASNDQPVQPQG